MKFYQVIFIDEYDNFYEIGLFKDLSEAEPLVNDYLKSYVLTEDDEVDPGSEPKFGEDENLGPLVEYAGTFGPVFDRTIWVEEGAVQVRGFIKDAEETIKELQTLVEKN